MVEDLNKYGEPNDNFWDDLLTYEGKPRGELKKKLEEDENTKPKTVIIYGPAVVGKTVCAEIFAKFFGCINIKDGWDIRNEKIEDGTLHITNDVKKEA